MRRCFKIVALCMALCLGLSHLYAAETSYITEVEFAKYLNAINKTGAKVQIGSAKQLTREKAATMIIDYLGYTALSQDLKENTTYIDVTKAKGEIELLTQLGIMNGVGEQKFNPQAYMTEETAQVILANLKNKLQVPSMWQHACYAISSSSQMDWIKDYDAISFGWAELVYNEGHFNVSDSEGDFKVPMGFAEPMDLAKANGVETYLMVYFDGSHAKELLSSTVKVDKVISEIIELASQLDKEGVTRSFDGVTIDFEGLYDASLKTPYVNFLKQLKERLALQNKKLSVAVQPTLYYRGYDYKGIGEVADHVILMAHDYGARSLSKEEQQAGITTTPLTPIDDVYSALLEAKTAIVDTSKIALQFSFASLQWQKQGGKVLNEKAYTPSYDKIAARINLPETIVKFEPDNQSTYATYEENGITNIIWYEDVQSIKAKMELAKLLDIRSFSYWRLGIIPNEIKGLNE